MSLSGIAAAIGALVDAGIVVTENAFPFLEKRGVDPKDGRRVWETVLDSTRLVGERVVTRGSFMLRAEWLKLRPEGATGRMKDEGGRMK
jgi:Cu(I)/Ag(I) efflux system membrane protein CusA/SilA